MHADVVYSYLLCNIFTLQVTGTPKTTISFKSNPTFILCIPIFESPGESI